jgi:hydroxymethylglutaryl-CoA lyase
VSASDRVTLIEVGPRDGLQNEPAHPSVAMRVELIERLIAAGLTVIEAGSFVSPKWVPQMADTARVLAAVGKPTGVRLPVLVPNLKGLADAVAAPGVDEIAVFIAASESFSRRNINCDIAESLARVQPVADGAKARGWRVRGYISCVLGCPYEGAVDPGVVVELARQLVELGCYEVSLGDTIGVGTAGAARALVRATAEAIGMTRVAVHFHDTWGQALANILASVEVGVRQVDAAVAGLGGCPYAVGATGNVATEDVVYMLHGMGLDTGVDLDRLAAAGRFICAAIDRPLAGRVARALAAREARSPS